MAEQRFPQQPPPDESGLGRILAFILIGLVLFGILIFTAAGRLGEASADKLPIRPEHSQHESGH